MLIERAIEGTTLVLVQERFLCLFIIRSITVVRWDVVLLRCCQLMPGLMDLLRGTNAATW